MPRPKNTTPKTALKIYVEEPFLEQLRSDAERFGLASVQEVMEQVLRQYIPFWRRVKEVELAAYQEQVKQLSEQALGKPLAPETVNPRRAIRR